MDKSQKIVDQMMSADAFSRWMGMEILHIADGYARVGMQVRKEMLNGHGVAHGGITYSLSDSAFAFASNTHGQKAFSIETSINHIKPVFEGDQIVAEAQKESISKSLGQYIVRVFRGEELVALFKGVVYRKQDEWSVE